MYNTTLESRGRAKPSATGCWQVAEMDGGGQGPGVLVGWRQYTDGAAVAVAVVVVLVVFLHTVGEEEATAAELSGRHGGSDACDC